MSDKPNNPFQFWQELKRRKVVRVIPVYAAASFVLLELVDIITEPFGLPDWTLKFVFVLLCVGFIISIILSWVYDVTPEGVKKTKPATQVRSKEKQVTPVRWKISTYISVLIIIAFVVFYIISNIKQTSDISKLEKSIAVLPFDNMSIDEEYSHMGDAITDEIILELQKIKEFDRVLSRTSTMQYKDNRPTIPEIAEKLGVNYIIEGSIQRHKEDVSIRVQVIRAKNEDHVWAKKYDDKWEDIFSIQDEIAFKVANELKTVLSPEEIEEIDIKPTDNIEAYDLYLLGRYHWNKRTEQSLKKSIEYFEQAIEMDSDYALAYAGLSDAYFISADWNYLLPEVAFQKAWELAQKAVLLDDNIAEAYTTLGGIAEYFEWKHEKAESLYHTALTLNPNYATAHQWYALFLTKSGRFDEAITYINQALQLDPLSTIMNYTCGLIYYHAGNYDNALLQYKEILKSGPEFPIVRFQMFLCYLQKGLMIEAIEEYQKVLVHDSSLVAYNNIASEIYSSSGTNGFLNFIIDLELNNPNSSPRYLAIFYALSGDKQKALDYIEYNVNEYVMDFMYIKVEPAFINLRSEPRFVALLRKVGFEE